MAMHKNRLLFKKEGRACYISHLDLMATFQRAFLRADVAIWQTEGFNRHAFVSIALPLSVGYSSNCEILEFNLEAELTFAEVVERLNHALPEGITVLECYEAQVHCKKITDLDWVVTMEYDNGIPEGVEAAWQVLLSEESHIIRKKSKKSKKGFTEVDIIPMVKTWTLERQGENLVMWTRLAAQNPGLNPSVLLGAFGEAQPELAPDFIRCHRAEVYADDGTVFR